MKNLAKKSFAMQVSLVKVFLFNTLHFGAFYLRLGFYTTLPK